MDQGITGPEIKVEIEKIIDDIEISPEVLQNLTEENNPSFSASDWPELTQDTLDIYNRGQPLPPPYPYSEAYYKLEKALEHHYNKGRKVFPLRLQEDEFGKKETIFCFNWNEVVLTFQSMLYYLRKFKDIKKLSPTCLGLINGKESNTITVDLDYKVDMGDSSHLPKKAEALCKSIGAPFFDGTHKLLNTSYILQSTANSGEHIIAKWDPRFENCATNSTGFFGKDTPLDLRGQDALTFINGWVVAADGHKKYYKIWNEPTGELAPLPDRLRDLILMRERELVDNEPINIAKATLTWDNLTEEIQNNLTGRLKNNKETSYPTHDAYSIICKMVGAGLKKEVCLAKIQEFNICGMIEREDRFEKSYKSALQHVGAGGFNFKVFKDKIEEFQNEEQASATVDCLCSMVHDENEKLVYVVPGLMGEGQFGIIAGPAGLGKTILNTNIAYALSTGDNLLGDFYPVPEPVKVGYFVGELDHIDYINNYLHKMDIPVNSQNLKFYFLSKLLQSTPIEDPGFNFLSDTGRKRFEGIIKKDSLKVIFLDSALCFFKKVKGIRDETDAIDVFLSYIRRVASTHRVHILISHHFRKKSVDSKGGPKPMDIDDIIGSSLWSVCATMLLGLDTYTIVRPERSWRVKVR